MSERHDLLLVPEGGGFPLPKAAAHALLRGLALSQQAIPFEEAVAKSWAEVYLRPGETAHTLFVKGPAPEGAQFVEAALFFGDARRPLPWGGGEACFWFEIRGAAHPNVATTVRDRFERDLGSRPSLKTRPHAEPPPRRIVPEDERPTEKPKKLSGSVAPVGTRVEEL